MTLFIVCTIVLATGKWNCPTEPMPLDNAVAVAVAANSVYQYEPGKANSPWVLWPTNQSIPGLH